MHRHRRGGPHWWPENEQWPPRAGPAPEEWSRFGRKIFAGFAVFLTIVLSLAAVVGALIATAVVGVSGTGRGAVVAVSVAVFVGGMWLARRTFRRTWYPVREMIDVTGRLADGDYTARVNIAASPGMRAVASSVNSMAAQLEQSDERRRQLMADLGHELRTPLAVIRGEVEAIIDGVHDAGPASMGSLLDEVTVMERLIEDLRVLTLSEAGRLPLSKERTDLGELVADIASAYRSVAHAQNVRVEYTTDSGIEIEIDPVRVRQAITNLVVNALRSMPNGGDMHLRSELADHGVHVDVIDTGTGIDPERLPVVFDRFVKSSDSPGSGLGLAIARGLAQAHGGDVEIMETGLGGTTVRLTLPR